MNLFPHHVLVWVSDMKRAITFYTSILGLKLISESADFSQVGGEKFWIALQSNATTVNERSKSPVILVGHSYGGFVITNAAYNNPSVKGLVYIAAFAPNEGQSLGNFIDASKLPKGFLVFDSGGFIYINPAIFHQAVAPDTDPTQAKVLAAVQKPYNKSILVEKSGPPAWKQLPSWYQVSENDSLIPPDVERMFAKQINATTISIPSSHASPLSHPNEVAQLILNVTKGAK